MPTRRCRESDVRGKRNVLAKNAETTVATGRDYPDVAPTSGTYVGAARGTLSTTTRVGVTLH